MPNRWLGETALNQHYTTRKQNTPGETAINKGVRSGWGIEQAITLRMSLKLEYLNMDFGSYEGYSDNQDLVRAGLNYRF